MNDERLKRVREAMEAAELDALVCRLPENVLLLSGHWPLIGWSYLFFPVAGKPLCIVPHCDEREAHEELWEADCVSFPFGVLAGGNPYEDIAGFLKERVAGGSYKRIGFEGSFETVAPPWNAAEPAIPADVTRGMLEQVFGADSLIDATDLLNEQRARKTDMEQEKLRAANEIATFGMRAFREKVDVGISGVELVALVEHTIATCGVGYNDARRVRAFAQVSTGAEETAIAYRPMVISTPRPMKSGDLAVLELAVVVDGFWADRTRVRVAGKASEEQNKMFKAVRNAQEAVIDAIRPGVTSAVLDRVARDIIHAAGYDDAAFLHVTGHGLGLRYHEPTPLICPGGGTVLEEGMVHTVEPGIYIPGIGGIRLEENVIVTAGGCEVMGECEKDMETAS